MELVFGMVGFLLVQLGLVGLFSLSVPPFLSLLAVAAGLCAIGMAFSHWKYRSEAPFGIAIALAIAAAANLAVHGGWWWSVGVFAFSLACLGMGLRLTSP